MNIPRIWLGYAQPNLERQYFHKQLGCVFMPATVQIMGKLGMQSYIPAVLPKRENLPDEIALVFYPSPEAYSRACKETCGGRAYGALHQSLFQFPRSRSSFPKSYTDELLANGEKFFILFDVQPNWQTGNVLSEVLGNDKDTEAEFLRKAAQFVEKIEHWRDDDLTGVYLYIEKPLVICWSCWRSEAKGLAAHFPGDVIASIPARPAGVPELFAPDPGVDVAENQSMNFQFTPLRIEELHA